MYPEMMIAPMRQELTSDVVAEALTANDVSQAVQQKGTVMVVVNSVCGCAAGKMRPGVRAAIQHSVRPERMITVFAGQDREATETARGFFTGYPPSSPSIGILRDGQLVYMMERRDIEMSSPEMIASALTRAFDQFCAKEATSK